MRNLLIKQDRWYHQNDGIKLNTLKTKTWATIAIIILATAILVSLFWYREQVDKLVSIQPVHANVTKYENEPEATSPEQAEIIAYIKEVFGKDAPKAFKLLSCENASLNPSAVNTAGNHPVGSRDTGVFQINEYWQKVQYKFLLNWKVNVQIAHQIYTENGNTFERWTCGRRLGI